VAAKPTANRYTEEMLSWLETLVAGVQYFDFQYTKMRASKRGSGTAWIIHHSETLNDSILS